METLHANLETLETVSPPLAELLKTADSSNELELVKARSGETTCRFKGRFLCSRYAPRRESARLLAALPLKRAALVVFWGLGMGHLLKEYLDTSWDTGCHVLVVETELPLLRAALMEHDLTRQLASGALSILHGPVRFTDFYDYLTQKQRYVSAAAACVHVEHPVLTTSFKDFYQSAKLNFHRAVEHLVKSLGNDPGDGLIGLKNFLANIPTILETPGLNQVFNHFEGEPAVIVSAGPSLGRNIHLLRGIEDRAVILCCDAVLKAQIDQGFRSHMAFALERAPETANHFACIPADRVQDTFAVSTPISDPSLYTAHRGPHVMVFKPGHKFGCLPVERGTILPGHSVANMAFQSAAVLGCDPIVFIGQDLAYGRDECTHWPGASYAARMMEEVKSVYVKYRVPGNIDETVLTNQEWDMFRKQFEVQIAEYQGVCINATEGGAKINGTIVMPFQEAIDIYMKKKVNARARLKQNLTVPDEQEIRRNRREVLKGLEDITSYLDQTVSRCRGGISLARDYPGILQELSLSQRVAQANGIMKICKILTDEDRKRNFLMNSLSSALQVQNQIELLRLFHEIDDTSRYLEAATAACSRYYHRFGELATIMRHEVGCTVEKLRTEWD
ncbi:MAG: DUF115 domain-containing protein [bacterium]|jgi:hypothetical protein|nr:DUF115 domain-containing protein [bacterium]